MAQWLTIIGQSTIFRDIGILFVAGILIAPIALRIAGLTSSQIVALLTATMQFVLAAIKEFRETNKQ